MIDLNMAPARSTSMSATGQRPLFPLAPAWPDGFRYRREFLTPEEEAGLMAEFSGLAFRPFEFRGVLARRQVVYFGWSYDFGAGRLRPAESIPAFLLPIRDRAAEFADVAPDALPHVLVNQYPPGAAIGWHRDRPQFEDVVAVSLGVAVALRLRRGGPPRWERRTVTVEPGSIYLLRGLARREWEHSTPPAPGLRYSITFRSLSETAKARLPAFAPPRSGD